MHRWWAPYQTAAAAALVVWSLLPVGAPRDVAFVVVGLLGVAAMVVGIRTHRPAAALAWYLLAAGQLVMVAGDAMFSWYAHVLGVEPFPSPADVVYLSAYPFLVAGLVLLIRARRRGPDPVGRLEAGIATAALGLLVYVFVAEPILLAGDPPVSTALALGYPVVDVLVIAALARLSLAPGARPVAYQLLVASMLLLLVADVAYAFTYGESLGSWLDVLWLLSYLLTGAAALHPSMRQVGRPATTSARLTRWRMTGMVLAGLVAPSIESAEVLTGREHDTWPVRVGFLVVVGLTLRRMYVAVQHSERAVRQRQAAQAALAHQASHDDLTGIANRSTTIATIEEALARAHAEGGIVGLMFLDIDHFKAVNDTYGHAAGDEVLQHVTERARASVRATDLVGRVGGDEIVVLVDGPPSEEVLHQVAQRVLDAVRTPLRVRGRDLVVSASVGVALCHDGAVAADVLLQEADAAAYRAKSAGRGRVEVFDEELRRQLRETAELEVAIRHGLAAGDFVMHYQPIVDVGSGDVVGYEALARWDRPGHGVLAPAEFIPLAEQSSLIRDVGRWGLVEACGQIARWDAEGRSPVTVAVNISGRHLASPAVVDDVEVALSMTGVDPRRLVLEITETTFVHHPEAPARLQALRDLGVGVSIDDFGTGYTSIGRMQDLPASTLKIDRSLVAPATERGRRLLELVVHAAHATGLAVVAEGVETAEQLEAVRATGCDLVQGFHLAHPLPVDRLDVPRAPVPA